MRVGDYLADFFAALIFAQRAFCAAAIFALPAALILPFLAGLAALEVGAAPPKIEVSSFSSLAIWSLILAALINWAEVNDDNELIVVSIKLLGPKSVNGKKCQHCKP